MTDDVTDDLSTGSIRVRIPTPLRSYTAGAKDVLADGTTVGEVLDDLDQRYPGMAFRVVDEQGVMRPHMIVWLHGERCPRPHRAGHARRRGRVDAGPVRRLNPGPDHLQPNG